MPEESSIRISPLALVPTRAGCAVFIQTEGSEKVGVIYVDPSVGFAINLALSGQEMPRPMTHDLLKNILDAFQATMKGACIVSYDADTEIYKARIILEICNEVMERKIVEVDARPGDALAIAIREEAPFYMKKNLWNKMEDVSGLFEELRQSAPDGELPGFL